MSSLTTRRTRSHVPGPARLWRGSERPLPAPAPALWPWPIWLLVVAAVILWAFVIVQLSGMTPSFDPYGWLTWGHQLLYGNLNLNAAPSWKPLMIIFTLPFALFGHTAPKLLSIVAVSGTLSIAVFAGRIAYRLAAGEPDAAGARPVRVRAGAWVGALLAAIAALALQGHDVPIANGPPQSLWHLSFIADSDPLITALALAAVDAHLTRRPRLAFVVLFLTGLGRPEAWPFLLLYGLWLCWRDPRSRLLVVTGGVMTLVAWYLPDAVAAKSIFQASKLDMGKQNAIVGDPVVGVVRRWVTYWEWPLQLAGLIGAAIGIARRDWRVIGLVAACALWLLVEAAFSLHGLSGTTRYVMEPAALMVAIGGYGIAQLLIGLPAGVGGRALRAGASLVGLIVTVGVLVGTAHFIHLRESRVRNQVSAVRNYGVRMHHLIDAVRLAGGSRTILDCGAPAALNQYQTQLAWTLGLNGSQVMFDPTKLLALHDRVILFTQTGLNGWTVRAYNVPAPLAARCDRRTRVSVPST